ncbi:hypothetical protein D3C80_1706330 [compost metagenome]
MAIRAGDFLERAVPSRVLNGDGAHFDAVLARITNDLSRRIKAHRKGVHQCGGEGVREVAFDEAGCVGNQSKRSSMALREAIGAETFKLLERSFGEFARIAIVDHAVDQLGLEP